MKISSPSSIAFKALLLTPIIGSSTVVSAANLQASDPTPSGNADEIMESIQDSVMSIWFNFIDHVPFIAAGFMVLLFSWLVAHLLQRFSSLLFQRSKLRQSLKDLLGRLLSIAVWILGLLLAAMIVFPGLTPAKALGALGLVSIAVGFAFKDIFENFFAGILLLWRFPFENGDFIECQGIVGRVEEITIRMTRIRKSSGELVVVPNAFLFKNPVEVLTDRDKRRVTIVTGVAYDEDVKESVKIIGKALKRCETVHQDEPIQIFPQAFGASSIDIEVTWWTDAAPVDIRRSRGEVVAAVKSGLDDAGIEIPFPYRTLTFKEPLTVRQASNKEKKGAQKTAEEVG